MNHRRFIFAAGLLVSLAHAQTNGVPQGLLAKLGNGVNVTRWFCYQERYDNAEHNRSYLGEDDFAVFRKIHATFARLCLSPEAVYRDGAPNAPVMPYVDGAIERFKKHGMATLFDLHDNGQLKLDEPGHNNSGFVRFWEGVARRYKGRYYGDVVFELLNEPVFKENPQVWFDLQERTVRAIRAIDPRRTIMVSSNSWSGVDNVKLLKPLPEKNLVYTFHCYDPFLFTHQGASWAGDYVKNVKSIPFPSSPEAISKILDDNPEPNRASIRDYGNQRVGKAYLAGRMKTVMDWAHAHRLPMVLGEFGAYPPVSPPDSRARWFEAMREVQDQYRVPRAIWGYDDALGLGRSRGKDGKLQLDPVVMRSFYRVRD